MKKLFLLFVSMVATAADAKELKSYHQIYDSLQSGKKIKMVIDFDYCSPKPSIDNLRVYAMLQAVMMQPTYIQFSNSPLTTNHPQFPNKPVLENCTYKLTDKNELTIVSRTITLPDYIVANEMTTTCPLGTAVKMYI